MSKSEGELMEERKAEAIKRLLLDSPDVYVITAHQGEDGTWIREIWHGCNELNNHLGTLEELTAGSMVSDLSRLNGGPCCNWRVRLNTNAPAELLSSEEEADD